MEKYYHGANINDLKTTETREEDTKADKLRSLPCIAAELLAGNLYVQSVMIGSTCMLLQDKGLRDGFIR
jgi:hypothetical protein